MKNIKIFHLLFFIQGCIVLSSCSKITSSKPIHSFKAAINVKENMQDFNKVLFKKFDNLNLGFFKGKIIIRLDIQNKNLHESFMFVNNDMINRNYSFYKLDKRTNSLQLLNKTIDTTIQDHRTFNFPNPNFKIDLAPNEKATFFIETISDGRTVDATPQLMSMTSYSSFINENTIWSIVFLGIVACLLLINIYQWTIYKEKIYLYYTFYMLATFIMYVGLEGHLYNFGFNKVVIDHAVFVSVRIWILSLILYTSKFLDIKAVAPRYFTFIKWCLITVLGGSTAYQFIFYYTSIAHLHYFENTISFIWLLVILVTISLSAKTKRLELKYYLIPLICFLLFTIVGLIDGRIQILPGTPFFYIKFGTIVEFIGFTYFMTVLIRKKLARAESLEKELQKNKLDLKLASESLKEKNRQLSAKGNVEKTDLVGIFKLLENSLSTESDWAEFKLKFKELNPDFLNVLLTKQPDLTKSEIRLLVLIKIGYSQKEIANLLNIASDSVKKAKSRVRKKMNLTESISLNDYLGNI